jgi:hypothetical protein
MKNFLLLPSILISCILTPFFLHAQCDPDPFAAQNRWFSTNSGNFYLIDFSSGNAVLDTATNRSSGWGFEGSAVAVNPITNELLFFTDGNRVVRASDWALSPTLVGGNASATEAAAIIPLPGGVLGDDFVVFGNNTNVTPGQLRTAIYKLSTNTVSNVTVQLTNVGEALEVIPQTNGSDYWILVNQGGNTRVYAYTAANGFDNTIVSSISLGQTNSNRGTISWIPQQPNTVLIGNYNNSQSSGVIGTANFNRATGQLSNYVTHITGQLGYAPALSPNGRYIYYTTGNEGWQGTGRIWDLQTNQEIRATVQNSLGGARLAPDGRIYWAWFNSSTLVTFSNPNDPANGSFGTFSVSTAISGFNLPNNTYWACESVCEFAPTPILNASALNPNCPDTTANLTSITASNQPPGFELTWHTATPANGSNRIADPTKVKTGTYYAAFFNTSGGCFGNAGATVAVTVTTKNCLISGRVFHDGGVPDGLINTSGTNTTSVLNAATHVSLINAANEVLQTKALEANGSYSLSGVPIGDVRVVLHRTPVGSAVPALAAGWVNTAEGNTNVNPAGDGMANGIIVQNFTGEGDIAGLNFGVQQRPTTNNRDIVLNDVLLQQVVSLESIALSGNDFEDGGYGVAGVAPNSRFIIKSLPAANTAKLLYNGADVVANQVINSYNGSLLAVQYTNPDFLGQSPTVQFQYSVLDQAGFESVTPAIYTIQLGTPLPVLLTGFSAVVQNGTTLLNWTTASERNNKGFNIERSSNGVNFATIDFVQARDHGNSTLSATYQFTDFKPLPGENYYRLRQVDFDGQFAYSPIRKVHIGDMNNFTVYPNPVPAEFFIKTNTSGPVQIIIYDANGRSLMQQQVQGMAGQGVSVRRPTLPAGIYFMEARDLKTGSKQVTRIMIQ